jgi:high-affinity iron transporter
MVGALIIVFREVLEAGLIIGIVLAATRQVAGSRSWIYGAIAAGVVGSIIVAAFTGAITAAFEGYGQELFNAAILCLAVGMLIWHNVWMSRHGRTLAGELKASGQDVAAGRKSFWALFAIVALAVLREGSEVVLFLYGVAVSGHATAANLLAGSGLGLLTGAIVSLLTFGGLVHIPMRHFFAVTNWLITLLAAGMAAQAVSFLEKAGVATILSQTMWDSSWLLDEDGLLGRILHTLVGYTAQPSALQLVAYVAVVLVVVLATRGGENTAPPARKLKQA